MPPEHAHHAITVLARLAARSPEAERHLATLLRGDLERFAAPAAEVATELGAPLDRLLGEALRDHAVSAGVLAYVWRRAKGLDGLRLVLVDLVLARLPEMDEEMAAEVLVRGSALLAEAGRTAEAVALAPRALAAARALPSDFPTQTSARALAELADVHAAIGDHDTALSLIAEAVELASRRLVGQPDPIAASLLTAQADHLRRTGDSQAVRAVCDRAIQFWEVILEQPDGSPRVVADRMRDASTIHVAVGSTATDVTGGPRFGDYRLNSFLADDGQFYLGVRQWSTPAALRCLMTCRYLRAMAHLRDADPGSARADLMAIDAIHAELAETGHDHPLRPHILLANAVYSHWIGDENAANVARTAVLAANEPHPETALAQEACVAPARPEYFARLLDLLPLEDRLGRALLEEVQLVAVRLRRAGRFADALALHELVLAAEPEAARHHVALANTQLRLGDVVDATAAARRAVAMATESTMIVVAYHALSRCQDASGDRDGAIHSGARAAGAAGALVDADPTFVIGLLAAQATRGGSVPGDLVARMISHPPSVTGEPAVQLVALACQHVTTLARSHDPRTGHAYTAVVALARRTGPQADRMRAELAWEAVMSFVDTGALPEARTAVADAAELFTAHRNERTYIVQYGTCAAELMAALWNSGQQAQASTLARTANTALRSPDYLLVRQQDNEQPLEDYLRSLDIVQGYGASGENPSSQTDG